MKGRNLLSKLIKILAESYGGGDSRSGGDFLSTEDGSETNQNWINTTEGSNGEGQGNVPDFGALEHHYSPDGQTTHDEAYHFDGRTVNDQYPQNTATEESDAHKSINDEPPSYGEELVDDNHADGSTSHFAGNMLSMFLKEAEIVPMDSPEASVPSSIYDIMKRRYNDKAMVRRPKQPLADGQLESIRPGDTLDLSNFSPAKEEPFNRYEKKPYKNVQVGPISPNRFESGDMKKPDADVDFLSNKKLPYSL